MKRIALSLLVAAALALSLAACGKTVPSGSETVPSSSETVPSSSETAPSSSETAPSSTVTAPSSSATAPSSSETAPSSSVTAPSSSVTAPSSSATAPSSSVTTPSSSVTAPSSSEAVPSSGKAVPSSGKAVLTSADDLNAVAENAYAKAGTLACLEGDARSYIELSEKTTGAPRYNKAQYPRLKQKADGSYILFFQYATYGPHIYYAHSKDLVHWESPQVLYNAELYRYKNENLPNGSGVTYFVNCDAVVLQNGDILAVTSYRNKEVYRDHPELAGIYLRRSTDGGRSWSTETSIYKGVNWEPSITELSNGEIQIFFSQVSPGIARWGLKEDRNSTGTAMISSTDGGYTWTPNVTEAPWQAKIAFQQYVLDVEGSPSFTDQMSVVTELYDGTLAAVCESKDADKVFHISVIYSDAAWSDAPDYDKTGPADRQSNLFPGAAPYIRKMPSGEVVIGYGRSNDYCLRVADGSARSIGEPILAFGKSGYWGSIEVTGANRLTAVYPAISGQNGNAILIENFYLNHAIPATDRAVCTDGKNSDDWASVTDAHFIGSASQAQATFRYAKDKNTLYLLVERRDDSLTARDRTAVYLADTAGKAYRLVIDAAGKVTLDSGSGAAFAAIDGKVTSASTVLADGMVTEIAVDLKSLGLADRTGLKVNYVLYNADEDGASVTRDTVDVSSLYDANTWLDVTFADGKQPPLAAGAAASVVDAKPPVRENAPQTFFDFADKALVTAAFGGTNGLAVSAENGYAALRITDNYDPYVSLVLGETDADANKQMLICYRNHGESGRVGLYYCAGDDAAYAYTAAHLIMGTLATDEEWHVALVDFSKADGFSGKLKTLRIDPYDGLQAKVGSGIDIAWIAFVPADDTTLDYVQ